MIEKKKLQKNYDKIHDVLYVYIKSSSTGIYFSDKDEDMRNVFVNRDELDNSIVGFIILGYRKEKTPLFKILRKYHIVA